MTSVRGGRASPSALGDHSLRMPGIQQKPPLGVGRHKRVRRGGYCLCRGQLTTGDEHVAVQEALQSPSVFKLQRQGRAILRRLAPPYVALSTASGPNA